MASISTDLDALVAELTLEEKAALTVGRDFWTTRPIERLGVPSIWVTDGPTGLRKAPDSGESGIGHSLPATCFPTESALASSWNVDLVYEVASAIAREAQAHDVQVVLGPGVNLKRSPLAGRNFEYFSEDPILSGKLAASFIRGLQEHGVGASLKHFVANEQESGRMFADSVLDARTLREVYLRPFEIAIAEANPWTLMCAYNQLNGTWCAEHRWLLHELAKAEWGYEGAIISDWFAVNDRAAGIDAGLHLQMPHGPAAESVVAAVHDGRLAEARLDEVVRELLELIFKADAARKPNATFDADAHHALARRAASESIVLLKNDRAMLPLDGDQLANVALIGAFAMTPRYQGSGSSQVTPLRVDTAFDAFSAAVAGVRYAAGYSDAPEPKLLQDARTVAASAAVAVLFVGLPAEFETEGVDRTHIELPAAHTALIEAVLDVQPNTVVVLTNGSAVAMPWVDRVPAIVEGWLSGQAGGSAVVDVLLGRVNPSGKLAETFPQRLQDTPAYTSFPGDGDGTTYFTERLFTGYRWYDAREIAPLFPFGHGLSYTTFEYSDLRIEHDGWDRAGTVRVQLNVRNTGECAGQEIVQLYVHEQAPTLQRPARELRAFAKVALEAGESQPVQFELSERDFTSFDARVGRWRVDSGEFDILIGASSRDIRLSASVTLAARTPVRVPLDRRSPIVAWRNDPAGRALVEPLVAQLEARLGGGTADADPMHRALQNELPVVKLVTLGLLDEAALDEMIASANRDVSRATRAAR